VAAIAYVGLGSNQGDRLALLRAATAALDGGDVRVVARSPVFETPAVTPDPQPPFLNAVVRLETDLDPRALLARCLAVESSLGRQRPRPLAPRTIDLDLLLHGTAVIDEPGLVVPHPRLLERPFVRVPLALVAEPGLRHPRTGDPLHQFEAPPDIRRFASL
jgi:2-amino-4-hydroxy-6-hydroxymethyldihydropteridine diphosphokinase